MSDVASKQKVLKEIHDLLEEIMVNRDNFDSKHSAYRVAECFRLILQLLGYARGDEGEE